MWQKIQAVGSAARQIGPAISIGETKFAHCGASYRRQAKSFGLQLTLYSRFLQTGLAIGLPGFEAGVRKKICGGLPWWIELRLKFFAAAQSGMEWLYPHPASALKAEGTPRLE
jgi:hypothetical protein